MFVLFSILLSAIFLAIDTFFIKTFQLENYRLKNYLKKAIKFNFSFGNKTPLVFTKRIKRLIFLDFLLKIAIFSIILYFIKNFWIIFEIFLLIFIFENILISFTFLFAMPMENLIKRIYLFKAKKKLHKMSCKKIAITGSFGKTSTKNILYQILSEEFDVCATPKSFNTPMGVCKTILENLKETDDFFVVEMGARRKGDINFLSKFVGVDFGIVTPIGNCHLETFGSLENIENTKFELCENAKDLVVFNGKSRSTKKLFERYQHKKFLVCDDGGFAYAKDVQSSISGSNFVMVIDKNEFDCKTKLLGKGNVDNVVVACAMAYLLGESLFDIRNGIKNLKPMPHRLELLKGENVTVIDDSYNSNFDGFVEALDILKTAKGRKIVVSPGMIELGKIQFEQNFKIGEKVAKVADFFVVMNDTNKKALFSGAKNAGMQEYQILFAKSREEQRNVLKKIIKMGDSILFENDFPDNMK